MGLEIDAGMRSKSENCVTDLLFRNDILTNSTSFTQHWDILTDTHQRVTDDLALLRTNSHSDRIRLLVFLSQSHLCSLLHDLTHASTITPVTLDQDEQ
jgi:hypothetical protein